MSESKASMLARGVALAEEFCRVNGLVMPKVTECPPGEWPWGACAYYRPTVIKICVPKCAAIGVAARAWSFPGYVIDRTPYGVIQHELGHHVDSSRGAHMPGRYYSDYSAGMRAEVREPAITSYLGTDRAAEDAEWFAEMFRLFVTNPDLLRRIRPRTHARLLADGFQPVFWDAWDVRMAGAPERTLAMCAKKVSAAGPLFAEGRE